MNPTDHSFIADLHLGHENVLRHDNRPFPSIETHDEHLTESCASAGRPHATLWLLGDVSARPAVLKAFMDRVRPAWCKVILIRGNHDDKVWARRDEFFDETYESRYLRVTKEIRLYLSHYAHRTWRNSHHGSLHLHGHSHGALPPWGRSMDVGANCIGYKPIHLDEVVERLKDQPRTPHHPPPFDAELARRLLMHAVDAVICNCGNSYVNAWAEQWLDHAASLGAYPKEGPFIGARQEVREEFDAWLDFIGGLPKLPDSPHWLARMSLPSPQPHKQKP